MTVQTPMFEKAGTKPSKIAARVEEIVGAGFAVQKFVENFEVLAGAAGALPKLRQLVLTMAVSGRLTRQMPSDGAADALLAMLAANNATPRKPKPNAEHRVLDQDAGPFTLPRNWRWARFLDVASIDSHLVDPASFPDLPHVAPDNIEKGTGRLLEYRTIREDGVTSSKHRFFPGQIVYSKIRPKLSKVVLVDFEGLCSADMYPLTAKIDRSFLQRFMLSQVFLEQVVRGDNRLAMPKVNQEQLGVTLVAVPPLAEQKRIVAKVDQLMALCDDLEARQTKKRETGTRLTRSALDALTTAEGPEEFDAGWKRVVENFDVLIDRAEKVGELRRTVLGIAIQGHLSARAQSDEPAGLLLQRLHAERVATRGAPSKATTPEAAPFGLPSTWRWARLDHLWRSVTDGDHQPPPKSERGVAFLTIGNVSTGKINFASTRFVSEIYFDALDHLKVPMRGDLLYTVVGSYGIPILVDGERSFCVQRHIAILKPLPSTNVRFLRLLMSSEFIYRQAQSGATGIAQPTVGLGVLRDFIVPVPPFQEQERIVAKVEQLMKVCDDLEAKLRRAEDRAAKLVEAVVQELVA